MNNIFLYIIYMSCSSPFIVQSGTSVKTSKQTVTCTGGYTLNGYSVKWGGGNWCVGCVKSSCSWGGWRNTVLNCVSGWDKCCTGIDYPTWTISLWPTTSIGATVDIPFTFKAEEGIALSETAPAEPYQALTITLESCTLTLTVDTTNIPIVVIDKPIELKKINDEFSLEIPKVGHLQLVKQV